MLRQVLSTRLGVAGTIVVVVLLATAAIGPSLAPYSPIDVELEDRLTPPTRGRDGTPAHWLGTDQLGRDILSRILHAARVTVGISLTAVALTAGVGIALGLISGFYGGLIDNVLMRIVDIQLAFPTILLAITMVAVLGRGIGILILVFAIAEWVRYVRVIRAQVLVVKEMQYVEAARALGAPDARIVIGHVLRNVLTDIIILMNLEIGRIILLESSLSYLGLGVQPPLPTWGNMVNEGRLYLQTSWWVVTFPGLAIVLSVLGLNLFGESLRGAYDPTGRE
ncbi:MAG: ABC transporter permease [Armatimonadota bacterium]